MTMQVEEDKARIANPRRWLVSKDDLRSLKEDIQLRIYQISEEQQRLELKDTWKSHYNKFTGSSVDGDETDLYTKIWMMTALSRMAMTFIWMSQPYSVSVTLYPGMSMESKIWQPQTILRRRSKICGPKFKKSYVEGRWLLDRWWHMAHVRSRLPWIWN